MKVDRLDLFFSKDWFFYFLVYIDFIFNGVDEYSCRVQYFIFKDFLIVKWGKFLNFFFSC